MIAALYVDRGGAYDRIPGIDLWPIDRDAREYPGPWPVVAHPPCQRWGRLGAAAYQRWGGEHNRPGNDHGCFAAALSAVERWGGVLEHPAQSHAWPTFGIQRPARGCWTQTRVGWTCEVAQSAYGHRAIKMTWLYYVGCNQPPALCWIRPKGTHQIGFPDRRGRARNRPTLRGKDASATPPLFRNLLIELSRLSKESP